MNTASKNSECEVEEDFPFFPKLSNKLHVKHYRKETLCLIGRKGKGITILCCVLPFCCTRKVVQAEKGSYLAHIITYLQNEKVIKQKVPDFFRRIKYLIIPPH